MQTWQQDLDLALYLARRYWYVLAVACWIACSFARATYRLWTRTRYLGEAWARQERVNSSRETALAERITDRLLKAFFKAPKPTLESLANDMETPFSLTPSTGSFPKPGKST